MKKNLIGTTLMLPIGLGTFINCFVARNTLIRLWMRDDVEKCHFRLLKDEAMMEWEILSIPEFSQLQFEYVTDIVTDRCKEAINIVVRTSKTREELENIYERYLMQREAERGCISEG